MSSGAHAAQRGFVRGRNLVAKVLEMDIAAQHLALRGIEGTPAVMLFWDFNAAFARLLHTFML